MTIGRILVAATGLGLSRKAVDLARAYAAERKVGGAPILANQGVAFPLAEVKRLTGLDVPRAESIGILKRLGFEPQGNQDTEIGRASCRERV